jgi:two-component system, NtrC family, nitrogen regulation sensor histidine kinase NtrY
LLSPHDRAFWVGLVVVVLSLISALSTYLILTGLTPIAPRNEVVLSVLGLNIILIIAMIAVLAWQAMGLWKAWRDKVPGARLHVRIVILFSIIAALPAILLAAAATTTFSRSIDGWFSKRTRVVISNSVDVARAYLIEHGKVIRTDVANMVRDLDASADLTANNQPRFRQLVIGQAALRDLPAVFIVDGSGKKASSPVEDDAFAFSAPGADVMKSARAGQVPVLTPETGHSIAAVAKLNSRDDRYLYVMRSVSPKVLRQLKETERSVLEYNALRDARGGLKLAHGLMYTMISMTSLLAAIWAGLWFAGRFVAPIRRLIAAAQEVSSGNLAVALPERRGEGDLRRLSETFNRMTRELKSQHDDLRTANDQLQTRRRFIEAVLSGVSAGVIGLDSHDRITLVSRSAEAFFGVSEDDVVGKRLADTLPVLAPVLKRAAEPGFKQRSREEISVAIDGEERTLAVRITEEKARGGDVGSVMTFDDVTELVTAQRTAAWADVARRIAHEIKNPLTPIILSSERLRRKYSSQMADDQRETFEKLTSTIERQAGDIKTMVDEFASFARIPKPVIEPGDYRDVINEPVILFREGHPNVTFKLHMPDHRVPGSFDRRLLTQAVTNLVKNATEAVETAAEQSASDFKPTVKATLTELDDRIVIKVRDNGIGLPKSSRHRLLEPYVTTKGAKGTGLGLAIVQKITEQHGGRLVLEDNRKSAANGNDVRGANVRITLPKTRRDDTAEQNQTSSADTPKSTSRTTASKEDPKKILQGAKE